MIIILDLTKIVENVGHKENGMQPSEQQVIRTPTFVICLERKNKERCDVNFPFVKQLFVNAQRMNAVDANTIDLQTPDVSVFAKYHIEKSLDTDIIHLSVKGAVGCAMSHINAWKKIMESGEAGIVIEDDINIDGQENDIFNAFAQLPEDDTVDYASFMYLNWGSTKITDHSSYNDRWNQISSRYFSGTQMYYVTPNGAKKLLDNVYPILTHIDTYIAYLAATTSYDFKGIFLKNNLYPFHLEWKDNLQSTLGHELRIKKILPDGNAFYYIIMFSLLFFLLTSIVLVIKVHKKK